MPCRKTQDQTTMYIGEGVERNDEAVAAGAGELVDRVLDRGRRFDDTVDELNSGLFGGGGDARKEIGAGDIATPQIKHAGNPGCDLAQQFEPLADEIAFRRGE